MWRRSTGGWRTGSARTTRRSCVVSLAASLAGGGWRRSLVDGGTKDGGTLFLAIVPWSPRATLLAAVPWLPRLLTARTLSANRGGRTDGAQLYRGGAEAIEEIFFEAIAAGSRWKRWIYWGHQKSWVPLVPTTPFFGCGPGTSRRQP
jgi:hypothetical protein